MYPCYSRRRHAILEKSGAKNIAACEKQGKQRKFGEHWKSIKSLLLKKKKQQMMQKRLTEIQISTKDFNILQNQL